MFVIIIVGCIGNKLHSSKTLTQWFFSCKGKHFGKWSDPTDKFTAEDPQIIIVARLDKTYKESILTFEIVDPSDTIRYKESVRYTKVRDV